VNTVLPPLSDTVVMYTTIQLTVPTDVDDF
jgi:hypothetical protein